MGNKSSIQQLYEKYYISLRLFNYLKSFQNWIEKCSFHPYHKSISVLFYNQVNKLTKFNHLISKEK